MDFFKKVIELAWSILDKNKECSINIATIDNKLTVSILKGRKKTTYCNPDEDLMLLNLKRHLST